MSYIDDLHISEPNPLDKLGVRFFESKSRDIHHYVDNKGKSIPGTTSVIGDIVRSNHGFSIAMETDGLIDNITLNRAAERGTRIHKGIEHVLKGETVPHGVLHESDLKHIEDFKRWQVSSEGRLFDWDTVKSEVSAYSKELGVAGTADILVKYKNQDRWHAWEIKTTGEVHRGAALQQAANIQQAKENFPEIANAKGGVDRGVLHLPEKGPFMTVSDKNGHAPYKTYAEDLAEFKGKAQTYIANGGIPAPSREKIGELASGILYEQVHGKPDFKNIYLGVDKDGKVDPTAYNLYKEEADKLGFELTEGKLSQSGKSRGFSVKSVKAGNEESLNRAKAALNASKKKEQGSAWSQVRKQIEELKATQTGDLSEGLARLGQEGGSSLMEALSKSNNLKYAAIGGAIGYAGGAIHEAIKNTDDPTSMYKEERHLLGGAIKGAVVAGAVGFGISAAQNLRNSPYSEEFVGTIGGSARGLCKTAGSLMRGAWNSAGAKLIR